MVTIQIKETMTRKLCAVQKSYFITKFANGNYGFIMINIGTNLVDYFFLSLPVPRIFRELTVKIDLLQFEKYLLS